MQKYIFATVYYTILSLIKLKKTMLWWIKTAYEIEEKINFASYTYTWSSSSGAAPRLYLWRRSTYIVRIIVINNIGFVRATLPGSPGKSFPLAVKPASHVLLDSSTRPHRVELHFVICASSLVQYALITCAQCVYARSRILNTHTHVAYMHTRTYTAQRYTQWYAGTAFTTCRASCVGRRRDRATSVFCDTGHHHTGMRDVRIARIHIRHLRTFIH